MGKSYYFYILFSLTIFQLVGCAPIAVVSAPVAFADRRLAEVQYIDQKIEIKAILETQELYEDSNITFLSYNQTVLLAGEGRSQKIIDAVENKIKSLQEVKVTKNFIIVQSKNSSIKSRAEDLSLIHI